MTHLHPSVAETLARMMVQHRQTELTMWTNAIKQQILRNLPSFQVFTDLPNGPLKQQIRDSILGPALKNSFKNFNPEDINKY